MTVKLQSNPDVLIADLIAIAKTYEWDGDYVELRDFIEWTIEKCGKNVNDYDLEFLDV